MVHRSWAAAISRLVPGSWVSVRTELVDQRGDLGVKQAGHVVQVQDPLADGLGRDPMGADRVTGSVGVGPLGPAGADRMHAGHVPQLAAQRGGRLDGQVCAAAAALPGKT
jgi:hypothetical protein